MKLNLPRLSYLNIGKRAEIFLAEYHSSLSLPIPIEEIAELKLGLSIIPIKRLKKDFDVDGSLDSTLSRIFIDFDLYVQQENRTRFTIAHEIGHLILHQEIFQKLNIKNEKDLYHLIENIDNDEYSWMEYQAYSFAGHLLVPKIKLIEEIKNKIATSENENITEEKLYPLIGELVKIFNVSGEVLLRRLQKEGLFKNNKS